MRIAYMSDLHLEFEPYRMRQTGWAELDAARRRIAGHPARGPLLSAIIGADLVVLAGDIDSGTRGIAYADEVAGCLGVPAIYVAGNHESYDGDLTSLTAELRAAAWATDGRVFYLEQDAVSLWIAQERVQILGCTLWTDYLLAGDDGAAMRHAQARMRDFEKITFHGAQFTPFDAQGIHRRCRVWLGEQIEAARTRNPDARVIVVSHHAPIPIDLESRVAGLEPCYASDLRRAITHWRPDAWFHGHSHRRHLTRHQDTWIAATPLGYPEGTAVNAAYNPGLLEL